MYLTCTKTSFNLALPSGLVCSAPLHCTDSMLSEYEVNTQCTHWKSFYTALAGILGGWPELAWMPTLTAATACVQSIHATPFQCDAGQPRLTNRNCSCFCRNGANPRHADQDGRTVFHWAMKTPNIHCLKWLCKYACAPELVNQQVSYKAYNGSLFLVVVMVSELLYKFQLHSSCHYILSSVEQAHTFSVFFCPSFPKFKF